jgi:hypothetical protein
MLFVFAFKKFHSVCKIANIECVRYIHKCCIPTYLYSYHALRIAKFLFKHQSDKYLIYISIWCLPDITINWLHSWNGFPDWSFFIPTMWLSVGMILLRNQSLEGKLVWVSTEHTGFRTAKLYTEILKATKLEHKISEFTLAWWYLVY